METHLKKLLRQLDAKNLFQRLAALESLRDIELSQKLHRLPLLGPILPNYYHVHTTASYGANVPGVFSVSHMVWAAHEAHSHAILLIEHESMSHMEEARMALQIVNKLCSKPLRLILGVEFKAPISLDSSASRQFSQEIGKAWGQSEAAWVVGIGMSPETTGLEGLINIFQAAKRQKAALQIKKLSSILNLPKSTRLESFLTEEGNITDRSLSYALAQLHAPRSHPHELEKLAKKIRNMFNPGEVGYAPFSDELPSYQELIHHLSDMGSIPVFTAQLRGTALRQNLPLLKAWGIGGLDVAGIEPSEPGAEKHIREFIDLAVRNRMLIVGGADYRGISTGWQNSAPWMSDPHISKSINYFIKSTQIQANA